MDIRSQVEDLSSVSKKITVEVPAEEAGKEYEKISREYQREARVPGFRIGKAPMSLVRSRYASDIRSEVGRKLVPDCYRQAITELGLRTVGEPSLSRLDYTEGKPLVFEAMVEVLPEISLPKYRGLEVAVAEKPVTEEDVTAKLQALSEEFAQMTPVEDRPAQIGDHLLVSLEGVFVGPEEEASPTAPIREDAVAVILGHDDTHPAFTENLTGLSIAEDRTFEVTYDAEYPNKKLAGKTVRFNAKVLEIKLKSLPKLDDDFAKDVGQFESLEALRDRVRKDLTLSAAREKNNQVRDRLLTQILSGTQFDLPTSMVETELNDMLQRFAQRLSSGGVDPLRANVNWQRLKQDFQPQAERAVRVELLLDEIARTEGVVITPEEIQSEIQTLADGNRQPVEAVRQYFQKEGRMGALESDLKRRRAMDIILESAVIGSEPAAPQQGKD